MNFDSAAGRGGDDDELPSSSSSAVAGGGSGLNGNNSGSDRAGNSNGGGGGGETSSLPPSSKMTTLEVEMQPLNKYDEDDDHDDGHDDDRDGLFRTGGASVGAAAERTLYPTTKRDASEQQHLTGWRGDLDRWLFPPHLPRECQLLRPENLAVPTCYLLVGILQGLSSPLINVLPLDLGATEAQQTTVSGIRSLPASFKLIFGFLSDNVPVGGYRRKPYMFLGWLLASSSLFCLMAFTNLDIPSSDAGCFKAEGSEGTAGVNATSADTDEEQRLALIPKDAPSIAFLSAALLGFGTGFWLADVMGDSIVAEKAKLEPPDARGSVQSTCYAYRFFGIMCAAPLSTYLYSAFGPYYVILVLAALPLTILPLVLMLHEVKDAPVASTGQQCFEIWNTVCSRAVWQPLGFVYLYNVMQVGNSAWREFLKTVLHFTSCQLNLILITAYVLLYLGIMAYKYFFIHWSWRKVYVMTTLLNGLFSVLQVLLIYGITFGLSNFWFALGDDAFAEFIMGVQFLPTTIMMVHLCPTGSEGASYAMFTTVHNSALAMSSALSTVMLRIWDVSRTAFLSGQLQGMINLTYLTTAIQVSALAFVGWLPEYKEDLVRLKEDHNRSKIGGTIFLTITFMSILYAIVVGVLNIVAPGWMGES